MPAAGFDFYSPFMSAAVNTSDGQRFPLWTTVPGVGSGDANASDVPISLSFLDSISVELLLGNVPRITAVLTPPFAEARKVLNSPVIEWGTSILEVQFGYTGGSPEGVVFSPVYQGVIKEPQISYGEDVQITINAEGTGGFGLAREQVGREFEGTREEIIQDVARGSDPSNPRDITVDTSEVTQALVATLDNSNGQDVYFKRLFEETKIEAGGYLTGWALIWKLVRECRCTMVMIENTLKIMPANVWMGAKPKRTLRFFDYPDGLLGPTVPDTSVESGVIKGVFPILQISSPTMAVYLPAALNGMIMKGVDSKTGRERSTVIDDARTLIQRVGQGLGRRIPDAILGLLNEETGDGASFFAGDPGTDRENLAEAEFEAMASGAGIQFQITTLLDPQLFPGDVVRVIGISERHDGNYAILKATSSVGSAGAQMQLETMRNAVDPRGEGDVTNAIAQVFGPVNNQEPDQSAPGVESGTVMDAGEQL